MSEKQWKFPVSVAHYSAIRTAGWLTKAMTPRDNTAGKANRPRPLHPSMLPRTLRHLFVWQLGFMGAPTAMVTLRPQRLTSKVKCVTRNVQLETVTRKERL